jgi:hypothetical protein
VFHFAQTAAAKERIMRGCPPSTAYLREQAERCGQLATESGTMYRPAAQALMVLAAEYWERVVDLAFIPAAQQQILPEE